MSEYTNGEDVLVVVDEDYEWQDALYVRRCPRAEPFHVVVGNFDGGYLRVCRVPERWIKPKPKTWVINGFEVPAPISRDTDVNSLNDGVFALTAAAAKGFAHTAVIDNILNALYLQMAFYTKEDARKNVAALRGTYDEEFDNEN